MKRQTPDEQRNGHRIIDRETARGDDAKDDMEPKGYPTSDRYRAETAHSNETHDPGKPSRPPREH